jgi:hypothetical protein
MVRHPPIQLYRINATPSAIPLSAVRYTRVGNVRDVAQENILLQIKHLGRRRSRVFFRLSLKHPGGFNPARKKPPDLAIRRLNPPKKRWRRQSVHAKSARGGLGMLGLSIARSVLRRSKLGRKTTDPATAAARNTNQE